MGILQWVSFNGCLTIQKLKGQTTAELTGIVSWVKSPKIHKENKVNLQSLETR